MVGLMLEVSCSHSDRVKFSLCGFGRSFTMEGFLNLWDSMSGCKVRAAL